MAEDTAEQNITQAPAILLIAPPEEKNTPPETDVATPTKGTTQAGRQAAVCAPPLLVRCRDS